jgi:PPOX class probable F420-dependent enzyme
MVGEMSDALMAFLAERHLATLVTLRADGSPHAVPVGFTFADGVARVITSARSVKVANVRRDPRVSLTQVDGRRWVTLAGIAAVHDDTGRLTAAVAMYEQRYRPPRPNPERVVIEIDVRQVLCNSSLR